MDSNNIIFTNVYLNNNDNNNDNNNHNNNHNTSPIKILIGTPAYGGQCYTAYTEALLYSVIMLSRHGIQVDIKFINNQIVTRARNMIASIFMDEKSYTHLMFIDSDVKWNPEYILMLLQNDLECSIGIYPNKKYFKVDQTIKLNPSSSFFIPHINKGDNLLKIKYAATGFMLLKKSAFYRIQKDVEKFYLPGSTNEPILLYNYFDCKVIDNDYLTEDYYFSYLFNKNGGEIWADKRISLLHIGQHEYGELVD